MENIKWGKKKEKVNLIGQMGHNILVTFWTIIFMDLVYILGLMAENMLENGRIIRCKEKVNLPGLMVENILEMYTINIILQY